ncbi:MAG: ABC transporter ATP-binding protein [Anaerolineae bacterium]|nr:ABC transporter ATP-binding protein [Anaerolineae bacterium]
MPAPIIEFNDVSKCFKLDRHKARTFQQLFISRFNRLKNTLRPGAARPSDDTFWSLRNVSFNIQRGESVGLIGSNGAGKSTSLKLMSRIILPTSGTVNVRGRVTALLELGAGFHPELSGRDNIVLNGAVMGLSRKEIEKKIDAIIEFAELSDFIDAPVKHYSSGMYARLGFSVAVHLDPEVLLVDEALAVGDQHFQEKCQEYMLRLKRKGVTFFLVSHSLPAIEQLCSRALWLDHGHLRMDDDVHKVSDAYYRAVLEEQGNSKGVTQWATGRTGSGEVRIQKIEFLNENLHLRPTFCPLTPLVVRIHYNALQPVEHPIFGIGIEHAATGAHIAGPHSGMANYSIPRIHGEGVIEYRIERLPLLPGEYWFSVSAYDRQEAHEYDYWYQAAKLRVVPGGTAERYGLIALEGAWKLAA